jgi:hypothetical protein
LLVVGQEAGIVLHQDSNQLSNKHVFWSANHSSFDYMKNSTELLKKLKGPLHVFCLESNI